MRPVLMAHHPGFSCPLCRTFADLESDVEVDSAVTLAEGKSTVLLEEQEDTSEIVDVSLPRSDLAEEGIETP